MSEGRTKEDRKKARKSMGTLKSLTVQPQTKQRYKKGLDAFYDYLRREGLTLPKRRDEVDGVVEDYLEVLWSEGEGRATASNFMAALQDLDPKLRGHLPASWRLMKTWTANEVPNRAPPMTETVLRAMVGWAIFHENFYFGLSLMIGYYGLLRTGELLQLQSWNLHMVSCSQPAVVSLGLTKSGKRAGAAESVTLTEKPVLKFLWAWKAAQPNHAFLTAKPHVWRQTFNQCLEDLRLNQWGFRPYSLRRGGTTTLFMKVGSLDRVLLHGRWTAVKTAKIYLNSGLAMLAELKISPQLLRPFHLVYTNFLQGKPQLEPTLLKKSSSGGRGKRKSASPKGKNDPIFLVATGGIFLKLLEARGCSGLAESRGAVRGIFFPFGLAGERISGPL